EAVGLHRRSLLRVLGVPRTCAGHTPIDREALAAAALVAAASAGADDAGALDDPVRPADRAVAGGDLLPGDARRGEGGGQGVRRRLHRGAVAEELGRGVAVVAGLRHHRGSGRSGSGALDTPTTQLTPGT